ncbi:hypothetical protein TorRG33x02_261610 [Trema orientale]|uniref:Uncharacterized protein n=1 Tax=Trema orientale TaxID=63057 RepID=A0A2P5D5V5_TREOI|nr:hypothetical protein TorRG33x02_261610 [Trema orientale]
MNAQNNVLNGHIIITEWFTEEHMYDRDWYIDLIIFLSNINFSYNATVSLHVCSEEALIIPESLRKICHPPWPILKHLKVMTFHMLKRKRELRNSLYWVSPLLETLIYRGITMTLVSPTDGADEIAF